MNAINRREVNEAISVADEAIYYLEKARKSLSSAGNWGLLDIFGGDTVSGLFKHMKLRSAESDIEAARRSLRKFSKELRDVKGMDSVEIGGFLTFADFFFDGFIADILVQSKIGKAQRRGRIAKRFFYEKSANHLRIKHRRCAGKSRFFAAADAEPQM